MKDRIHWFHLFIYFFNFRDFFLVSLQKNSSAGFELFPALAAVQLTLKNFYVYMTMILQF